MIVDAEDVNRLIKAALDHHDRIHDSLTEAQEIAIKEMIDRKITEAFEQHFEDYEHKEAKVKAELFNEDRAVP